MDNGRVINLLSDGSDTVKHSEVWGQQVPLEFGLGPSLHPVSNCRNGLDLLPQCHQPG